jgi:hypothetical protein
MLPTDAKDFAELISGLFAAHGRNPTDTTVKAWWMALSDRKFSDIASAVRKLTKTSKTLPSPAHVIELMIEETPKPIPMPAIPKQMAAPDKVHLLGARRHLEMFGEVKARDCFGNDAVNILLKDPTAGYDACDPRTYGGTLPQNIIDDIKAGIRTPGKSAGNVKLPTFNRS